MSDETPENIYIWRVGDDEPMHGSWLEAQDPSDPGIKYTRQAAPVDIEDKLTRLTELETIVHKFGMGTAAMEDLNEAYKIVNEMKEGLLK